MEVSPQVPEAILKLVERYEFHREAYKRGQFNETQLRREFVDPFFKTLGWDVDNTRGYSEQYKEVIHEDPIRIRGSTEFIDYAFRIGGSRKFIVEAKKPAVNIKDDAGPALQIRRYAWNAHLPLSILTDFEEFAVYDCTKKPMPGDSAATARIAYFTYKEYPEKWDWIASKFSQESILQGSFDRFATETKGKKGTATVDEAILADIEEWRDLLAKNIALRNPALSVEELNVAVQKTIDRILFLRICEDRGIEEYGCLQKLIEGQDVYQRLLAMFHRADTRYNSGLFHFNPEAGWDEMPDTLTTGLIIDDAILKKIIKRLYYPESPYEFSVISPVILGQVYEQFLGKVIRLTAGHQAKVEYKPEVKKAGGVYYTPHYIVDYIVQHTVGELVKDKTPRDVAKIRVLDPACGSGSFLLGAYQFLLDWHLTWYIHNLVPVLADKSMTSPEVQALLPEPVPKAGKKKSAGDTSLPIYKSVNGSTSRVRSDWKLTIAERKRILLNNIYGVDIDTQAVEVTKLSLLLKVLEEESQENVSKQLKLFEERALPSLHQNIKCGNSLIETDIYADMQVPLDDIETVKRINAFDWDRAFPEVMQGGGFDVVIGNPPYLFITELDENQKNYFSKKYETYSYRYDVYGLFIERSVKELLNNQSRFGFIIPHTLLNNDSFKKLRELLLSALKIEELIDLGPGVFKNAKNETMLVFLKKSPKNLENLTYIVKSDKNFKDIKNGYQIKQDVFKEFPNFAFLIDLNFSSLSLLKKLNEEKFKLGDFTQINQGLRTGNNEKLLSMEKILTSHKPVVGGKDVSRYFIKSHEYVQYEPKILDAPRDESIFLSKEKLIVQEVRNIRLSRRIIATFDNQQIYSLQTTNVINLKGDDTEKISIKYLLGLINSNLVNWYFSRSFPSNNHIASNQLAQIPIRTINFSDPADKARHDKMVTLVERILALHKQKADVKTDHEKTLIERQIEATDTQIDALVYELYGLTEEEIRIVEGEGK